LTAVYGMMFDVIWGVYLTHIESLSIYLSTSMSSSKLKIEHHR
jgi:hypothetical protein